MNKIFNTLFEFDVIKENVNLIVIILYSVSFRNTFFKTANVIFEIYLKILIEIAVEETDIRT